MVDVVADLHLHSRFSRAVSPQMTPPTMAQFGDQKGIDLLATGDWTHPVWFREISNFLTEAEEGLYKIKNPTPQNEKTRFLLSVEIASIYSQGGKGRRIHNLVFVPSFEVAAKVNKELIKRGFNLSSDGRPIIGFSSKNLLSLLLEVDERCLLIPAHVWTPWFGIYGQMSGFQSLAEAFEELAPKIYGIETGLSSDPEMNWQVDELKTRSILSFSDAHSPAKMGREATVFRLDSLSYENIRQAIMAPSLRSVIASKAKQSNINKEKIATSQAPRNDNVNKVLYTIEFYPEEGKYHYSGHRNCGITMTPQEQAAAHNICPVCKRSLTDGVMRRVQELVEKDPSASVRQAHDEGSGQGPFGSHTPNKSGLVWITDPKENRPPFVKIVPLQEIISEAIGSPFASPKVKVIFDMLCKDGLSEFNVLLKLPLPDIERISLSITSKEFAEKITDGIKKVRAEQIVIKPGYDGVFGVVKIWSDENDSENPSTSLREKDTEEQIGLEF